MNVVVGGGGAAVVVDGGDAAARQVLGLVLDVDGLRQQRRHLRHAGGRRRRRHRGSGGGRRHDAARGVLGHRGHRVQQLQGVMRDSNPLLECEVYQCLTDTLRTFYDQLAEAEMVV